MKIIEQTRDRLTTRHLPVNTWLIGGFSNCVALYTLIQLFFWEPTLTVLDCVRQTTQVTCQLQQKTWIGVQHQQTLADVRSVVRVTGNTTRVIQLVSPTQTLPVSNSSSRSETVTDIRAFLNDPGADRLSLRYNQPTAILFAPIPILLFGGLGLLLLSLTPANTCTFDKTRNQIVLKYWVFMEKQGSIETYPLSSFQGIEIEEYPTKIGNRYDLLLSIEQEQHPFHDTVVKKHSLSSEIVSIVALNYEQATRIADTIESFVPGK